MTRMIYRRASIGLECKTRKNNSKVDIKRRPFDFFLNQNLSNLRTTFAGENLGVDSIPASEVYFGSKNSTFPRNRGRETLRELQVSEIIESGRE